MNRFKYITYIAIFLCSTGIIIIILNIITLKNIETINAKIDKKFTLENIQGALIIDDNKKPLGVIGRDDRIIIESHEAPYNAIGHLGIGSYRNGQWVIISTMCTATLYNYYYIISAAHCVQDTENEFSLGELQRNIVFLPNSIKRRSNDIIIISKIIRSTIYPKFGQGTRNLNKDWVILITQQAANNKYYSSIVLSDNTQILPYIGINNENQNSYISIMGYSADLNNGESLGVHNNIEITSKDFMGALRSRNADMNPGASGGPLIEIITNKNNNTQYFKLHGVVSGHSCPPSAFIGVNCYVESNNNDQINIFAPIFEAKAALTQYLIDNNLENIEIKDIILNGPVPTDPPNIVPTNPPNIIPTIIPTNPPNIVPTIRPTITPTPTPSPCPTTPKPHC